MKNIKMPSEFDVMKMSLFMKVLSDSTRVKILFAIKDSPRSVFEIQELVDMSQSAVSHQLALLRGIDIVKTKREGNKIYYELTDSGVANILDIVKKHV